MRDPRLDKLAEVLVRYSAAVKPGDLVTIVGEPASMPAAEALFEAILRAGGHPSFHIRSEVLEVLILRHGNEEQIRHISPFEEHRLRTCECSWS
jgi:aminopeptidase